MNVKDSEETRACRADGENLDKQWSNHYCIYHKVRGHKTKDCLNLNYKIIGNWIVSLLNKSHHGGSYLKSEEILVNRFRK